MPMISLFTALKTLDYIASQLECALENLRSCFLDLVLRISREKSCYTFFSATKSRYLRVLIREQKIMVHIDNTPLELNWTLRFLGVILDANLNWRAHIDSIRKRVQPHINVLKTFAGNKWGIHPSLLLNVYKGFVRSVLDWNSQIFWR